MIGGTGNGHAAAWPVGHGCRGHCGPGTGTVTVELRVIPSRNRAGLPGAAAAAVGNHWHSVAAAAAWVTVATAGSRVSLGSGPTSPAVGAGLESRSLSARPSRSRAVSAAAATGHEPEALAGRLACAAVTEHRDRDRDPAHCDAGGHGLSHESVPSESDYYLRPNPACHGHDHESVTGGHGRLSLAPGPARRAGPSRGRGS